MDDALGMSGYDPDAMDKIIQADGGQADGGQADTSPFYVSQALKTMTNNY